MNKMNKPIYEKEYKEHQVFCTLDKIINFYKKLSFSVFGNIPHGLGGIMSVDSYFFSSGFPV
jgi:hypothetical protein